MNDVIRGRVVPTICDSSSCEMRWPRRRNGPSGVPSFSKVLLGVHGHEVEDRGLAFDEPLGEVTEEDVGRVRGFDGVEELRAIEAAHQGRRHRRRGLEAPRSDEARLAEDVARGVDREQAVLARGGRHRQLHLSRLDEVHRVVVITGRVDRLRTVDTQSCGRRGAIEHVAE